MKKLLSIILIALLVLPISLVLAACGPKMEEFDVTVTAEEGITVEYKQLGQAGAVYVLTAGTDDIVGYVRVDGGQGENAISINEDEIPNISLALKNGYINSYLKVIVDGTELVKTEGGSYEVEEADDGKLFTFSGAPSVSGNVTIEILGIDIGNLIHE